MPAVSSRRFKGTRGRGGRADDEDAFRLDSKRSPARNLCEALRGLCCPRSGAAPDDSREDLADAAAAGGGAAAKTIVSDARRLSYLTAVARLLGDGDRCGFSAHQLLCCLRVSLVHEATQVRAGALRAIRYVLRTEADVVAFNSLRLPYLVARSLDVVLRNEMERVQALKVVRRAIRLGPHICEPAIVRALVAVPGAAPEDKDRMMRAYLAALCELGILNPALFIQCGGVVAITRAILDCQTPRIAESLCGVLLFLLNDPKTRIPAKVDLRCLAAPYCDFHYRHGWMDKNRDEREMRFTCSQLALLSILRSWSGLLHFCDPTNESGFRAIVDVLYLNQLEVRKAILDLLYDLLGLPLPEWTDELSVALSAVDPSDFQDAWLLSDGFVAAEGKSILPHLAATGPNLAELHLALLLYCFLEVGLLDALVEVMVTSDTFISVRATVLLGQLLHLIHLLLPPETCNISPALPTLLSKASAGNPQALAAVAALQNLNSLLKARPASHSLFLDHILQYCHSANDAREEAVVVVVRQPSKSKSDSVKMAYRPKDETVGLLNDADFEREIAQRRSVGTKSDVGKKSDGVLIKSKSVSERTTSVMNKVVKTKKIFNLFDNLKYGDSLMKDSGVFENDRVQWDWNIIRAILKSGSWTDEKKPMFLERLVNYFKPTSNRFSHTDFQQNHPLNNRYQAIVALDLVTYLISSQDPTSVRLLIDLFTDIRSQVAAITLGKYAHECLFSPQHMANTMCQMYFLLIGRLCSVKEGLRIFKDTGLFESLLMLSTTTHHICYVKLIVSSLDYTFNSYPRTILAQTLVCNIESSRLYATQFLNVLIRARQKENDINKRNVPHSASSHSNFDCDLSSCLDEDVNGTSKLSMSNFQVEECGEMDAWILELLVKQARDRCSAVSLCALSILDEACSVPVYLDKLVSMKPKLKDLGDKGYLIWIRFASTWMGFQTLADAGYVDRQIRYWATQYNYRYTRLVEGDIHDCFTLLQRSEGMVRQSSARSVSCRGSPLPPHLYAQLVLHQEGIAMLDQHADIPKLLERIKIGNCSTEQEIMNLKAALWACGHIATSSAGIELVVGSNRIANSVFADVINLAQNCQVYSVRGTAFYVLGLMGSCYTGANMLYELGWLCVRHNRHDRWPIIQEENWLTKSDSENQIFQTLFQQSNLSDKRVTVDIETSETSDKTEISNADSYSDNCKGSMAKPLDTSIEITGDLENNETDRFHLRSISESSDVVEKHYRWQTLPQRLNSDPKKHQRSLSESKTFEKIKSDENSKDATNEKLTITGPTVENRPVVNRLNTFDHWHDNLRRYRNNSESSTSGVSSCDSNLGKYVFNERILTLSPIPSSSSLSAMKNSIPSRRKSETTRKNSFHSYSGSDVANSPPSQRDLLGYATFRSLSRHHRPSYANTSIDEISSFIENEANNFSFSSLRSKSKTSEAKNLRMSLFKYDWKPIATVNDSSLNTAKYLNTFIISMSNLKTSLSNCKPSRPMGNIPLGPCYIGISMPKCLSNIFPKQSNATEDSSEANYLTGDDSLAIDFESSYYQDTSNRKNDDSNFNSSFSDLSTGNENAKASSRIGRTKSRDRMIKHDQLSCLYCSRSRSISEVKKTAELREAFFTGMDSPKPSSGGATKFVKSPAAHANSLTFVSLDASCGSPTSVESNLSRLSDGGGADAHVVAGEILKHAERMGNPVLHKQCRQALLGLKQRHADAFQSVCLYSEVCRVVAASAYRLGARKFLQELFLDLNFDAFGAEARQVVRARRAEVERGEEREKMERERVEREKMEREGSERPEHVEQTRRVGEMERMELERSVQVRSVQERSVQERSVQERSVQERSVQERSVQERSVQERSERPEHCEQTRRAEVEPVEEMEREGSVQERSMQERSERPEHVKQPSGAAVVNNIQSC